MDNREIIIGIDPGVNNGWALYNGKEYTQAEALPFWELIERLEYHTQSTVTDITVIIENPNLISGLYAKRTQTGAVRDKIAQHVGANKQTANHIIDWCELKGIKNIRVRPSGSKWSSDDCKRITGYTARTNEHSRDAMRFIFRYLNERKWKK